MSVQGEMKRNDETSPTDFGEMNRRTCVIVSQHVVVSCCRCGVGEPRWLAKLSNCGLGEEW